ncbi:MAG TPA: MFS transporter [Candidatus Hydrogenedentes bacterium]|nr:MFS transporter [Candidatus Hydrogenedentota bacterium]HPG70139.1 MFS transporter [Candidatus Hydrogenedentota bacterium]
MSATNAETPASPPEKPPFSLEARWWRWRILISTYFAYTGFYLCRKVFSICKTTLSDEFDVGLDQIAHVWTAYLVAYMLGMFINSFVGRKWGPRLLLLGGLGISILFNLIFGFANSYWTFLVFMFFNGLVQAAGWPGCVGAVAEWLRRAERGTIMGIWSTNYLVGNIMVKSLGGYLLATYTWRYAFVGCTAAAFAIWWLVFFWQRTRPEDVGLPRIIDNEDDEGRAVEASDEVHITFAEYRRILLNPVVPLMGISYFCLKFLRYALDSWLPTFLDLQGMDVGRAAYYSQIFDFAGFAGVLIAGWALDRVFRGRWPLLCLTLGFGMVAGYGLVVAFGANPYALAVCFGLVGFMLYGPDTLLCGAASVQVAGERNAIAVAALVNGIGSLGPVIQEEVIGFLMRGDDHAVGMRNAHYLALSMSIAFVVIMAFVAWRVHVAQKRHQARIGAAA